MDARLDPAKALGLEDGDAHVIRNAGGVATEDAIRSLVISQRLLGTEEIILIHHTDCGMETFSDDAVKSQIYDETGLRPGFALEAFAKAEDDVKQTAARIYANPFVPRKNVRGFVYEVATGKLREVPISGD
jgi:carbonic anhydrase